MMNLHGKVMNLQCRCNAELALEHEHSSVVYAYKCGHRDARHAAAELANEADARIAHLEAQRGVLVGLLGEALPAIGSALMEVSDPDEESRLNILRNQITAALAAIAAERAGGGK